MGELPVFNAKPSSGVISDPLEISPLADIRLRYGGEKGEFSNKKDSYESGGMNREKSKYM